MRKRDILSILITVALLTMSLVGFAQQPKVYYYKIDDNISKPALRLTEKAVKEAEAGKFDYLMLELNTFGGELDAADKIRTLLLNTTVPTLVFINNNAASAGALISIACDSIYMMPGASIGAASVVNESGEIMPDKYQSYMRSLMRTTAEHNGRNPNIAQAMVDPDVVVPGVSEKGKVLTFTSEEAAKNGFCESVVNNREEALSYVSETPAEITEQELSVIDKIINFLVNPVVSGILIMCIVGGLYFELQTPGIGLPSVIAITAALLFFAPHYLEGLAAHWEILIFLAGLVLLMLEFFVVPGFGVTGISGIVLILASLVLTLVFNVGFKFNFNPEFNASAYVSKMTILVLVSSLAGFFLALWLGKKLILAETRFGSLALRTELESDKGFTSQDMRNEQYVGKEGVAQTILRPSGKINIDGEVLDATVEHGYVEAGEAVTVTKFENAQLFVRKKI
ncbi:MAG: nodulation protein NfeD [Bacteroidales bacterium]|nr:nodulation protein NfeD [Bacteroidales bacterium]